MTSTTPTAASTGIPSGTPPKDHTFGNYEVLSLLGRGGMAEVYKARVKSGPRSGQFAALKRLKPEYASDAGFLDLFTTEADVSRMLNHRNVVKVLETGEWGGTWFMAMEFVDGCDLEQLLERCRASDFSIPVDYAVYIVWSVLDALEHLHELRGLSGRPLGLVHCDLSPANVFVARNGDIKVGDFGVVRSAVLHDAVTPANSVWGKLGYLSPEQLGGQTVDRRTDVWSAGTMLFELLTNRRPFQATSADELRTVFKKAALASVASGRVSEAFDAVLSKALARNVKERYATAGDFKRALAPLYKHDPGNGAALASVVKGLFGER